MSPSIENIENGECVVLSCCYWKTLKSEYNHRTVLTSPFFLAFTVFLSIEYTCSIHNKEIQYFNKYSAAYMLMIHRSRNIALFWLHRAQKQNNIMHYALIHIFVVTKCWSITRWLALSLSPSLSRSSFFLYSAQQSKNSTRSIQKPISSQSFDATVAVHFHPSYPNRNKKPAYIFCHRAQMFLFLFYYFHCVLVRALGKKNSLHMHKMYTPFSLCIEVRWKGFLLTDRWWNEIEKQHRTSNEFLSAQPPSQFEPSNTHNIDRYMRFCLVKPWEKIEWK